MVGSRMDHEGRKVRELAAAARQAAAERRAAGWREPYTLAARWSGVCEDCGRRYQAAEAIRWCPTRKIAVHGDGCELPGEGKRYREAR